MKWWSGTPDAPPQALSAPAAPPEAASGDAGMTAALQQLAGREAAMLEGQVDFLSNELTQADNLVREAASTVEAALKSLDQGVDQQHRLAEAVLECMGTGSEGASADQAGGGFGTAIVGTLDTFVKHMLDISESSTRFAAEIEDIRDRAAHMEDMLGELSEIAGRTHLLSLNATIEAAHARQFGAGFAIVAGEVSKLADRSTALSSIIHEQISGTRQALERTDALVQSIVSKDVGVALRSKDESEVVIRTLETNNAKAQELVGQLEANAGGIAQQVSHVVRSLQFEDLVHQTLMACLQELQNLLEQAGAWRAFEARLAAGADGVEAIASLHEVLGQVEAARVQFKAVKRGDLVAGDVDLF
ncbi:methyl-accepting chemotaxis protein [Geothrix sp. 21YS21S-4]|uniref:methyl-accepting chemotaxis protein n=1 Tax=Geothrix sp. 21YS21S-4 TaxID=3068889 RepID=UPI0027B995FE|nr:methyl-accepting chemotaxis protein [Geothrix sp. 21YS21S-4]